MSCDICRHSAMIKVNLKDQMICRRYPPQLILVPIRTIEGDALSAQPFFPPVKNEDYCGEFVEAKLTLTEG